MKFLSFVTFLGTLLVSLFWLSFMAIAEPQRDEDYFKSECDDTFRLRAVGGKRAYCMDSRELPAFIGDEHFIFPEGIVGGLRFAKSETWKYGDNGCDHPLNLCSINLNILLEGNNIASDAGINIVSKQYPMPYDRLLASPFAGKLKQKPVKMNSLAYGDFSVIIISTGYEHGPPITDAIDGGVIVLYSQPNDEKKIIAVCSNDIRTPQTMCNKCRAWYPLNHYTYFWTTSCIRGFDEVKLFDNFMRAKDRVLSYKVSSQVKQ